MLRHTFVTTMLDAGVDLRDVQIAARHTDPRTTMRYDRARKNLDRHPTTSWLLHGFGDVIRHPIRESRGPSVPQDERPLVPWTRVVGGRRMRIGGQRGPPS